MQQPQLRTPLERAQGTSPQPRALRPRQTRRGQPGPDVRHGLKPVASIRRDGRQDVERGGVGPCGECPAVRHGLKPVASIRRDGRQDVERTGFSPCGECPALRM